jgi:hypothetical protein
VCRGRHRESDFLGCRKKIMQLLTIKYNLFFMCFNICDILVQISTHARYENRHECYCLNMKRFPQVHVL